MNKNLELEVTHCRLVEISNSIDAELHSHVRILKFDICSLTPVSNSFVLNYTCFLTRKFSPKTLID